MAINKLVIEGFKSIKDLKLDCKKINVLIGEPNTGKSNILEAIGLLSHVCYGRLDRFIRFETMLDLFYDRNIGDPIKIKFDDNAVEIFFKDGMFTGAFISKTVHGETARTRLFTYSYGGGGDNNRGRFSGPMNVLETFKFYRFRSQSSYPITLSDFLSPPDGSNFLHIVLTRKDLKRILSDLFKRFGYRIVFKPSEGKIEVQKDLEDIIVSLPYALSSETLQRIAFYLAAIYSNEGSVISFEEPEAHAFPYYMKYLAEKVALDNKNNQFFIATHNPYFLSSIIEKTPKDEIATFITYFEDYQTKVKPLSSDDIERALDMGSDVFFNIDQFLAKDSSKGN